MNNGSQNGIEKLKMNKYSPFFLKNAMYKAVYAATYVDAIP